MKNVIRVSQLKLKPDESEKKLKNMIIHILKLPADAQIEWKIFKKSQTFRRVFLLSFYTAMILLKTILNREIWIDPLNKLFGGWGLYEDGQFTTECIENFILFVPFSILLLWAFQKELLDESENIRFGKIVWEATKVVAVFSFLIEFTQLLFHLGTFQISDLTYNTLGGALGGVIYYLGYSRKRKK